MQCLKEQFSDVEDILGALQHNVLEPNCLASLDQNYYSTVSYLSVWNFKLDALNLWYQYVLQKVLEHKNFHESFGVKSDPPLSGNEHLTDPLKMDCDVDGIPEEMVVHPPSAQPGSVELESETEEIETEEQLLKVRRNITEPVLYTK